MKLSILQVLNAILYGAEQDISGPLAGAVRALAHHLYAHESLIQGPGSGQGVREAEGRAEMVRIRVEAFALGSISIKVSCCASSTCSGRLADDDGPRLRRRENPAVALEPGYVPIVPPESNPSIRGSSAAHFKENKMRSSASSAATRLP